MDLASARPAPPGNDARSLLHRSVAAGESGDHLAGAELAEASLADGTLGGQDRARALDQLALHRLRLGAYAQCVEHGLQALAILDEVVDLVTEARTHCTLALAFHETGLHDRAVPHVLAANEAARASGDATAEFWAMTRAAMIHAAAGDLAQGVELDRAALAIAIEVAETDAVFAGLNNLAMSLLREPEALHGDGHRSAEASARAEEALTLLERAMQTASHHPARTAHALSNMTEALVGLGRFDEAHAASSRASELAGSHGYHGLELSCAATAADILRAEGRIPEAIASVAALIALPEMTEDAVLLADLHRTSYEMHKGLGDFAEALHHYEEHHVLRARLAAQTAGVQSKILLNTLEIDQARHEAERSKIRAEQAVLRADELDLKAHTDALTGLPNRRALDRDLLPLVRRARSGHRSLAAAMIDLDHFKVVNDEHGHAIGDQALQAMAGILREATREHDLAVRTGGEEFLLVVVDATVDQAAQACERLLSSVRSYPWHEITEGLRCTVSAGVASLGDEEEVAAWLARADRALYTAKATGRDRVATHAEH